MDKEYLAKKKQEFIEANNMEGFYVLAGAHVSGVTEVKIDQYLLPEIEPKRLIEVVAAILDEVPEKTMKVLINGKVTPEEMRDIRMSCRNDAVMTTLSEEVSKCVQGFEKMGPVPDAGEQFKKTEKMLSDITKTVSSIQKELIQSKNDNSQDKKTPAASVKPKANSEQSNNTKKEADKVDEDIKLPPKTDMRKTVGDVEVDIECFSPREEERRAVSYFKAVNGGKIVDQSERAAEVKKILKHNPSDEQIEALTTAVKEGVSAEFLKFYADKKASPQKLAGITKLYKAMYDPQTKFKVSGQMG